MEMESGCEEKLKTGNIKTERESGCGWQAYVVPEAAVGRSGETLPARLLLSHSCKNATQTPNNNRERVTGSTSVASSTGL